MSDESVEEIALLRREIRSLTRALDEHVENDKDKINCPFTPDEIKTLKRGVQVLDTLGWIGKWVIIVTGGFAALGINWERIKQFLGGVAR